jgi:hypothetical protein
LGISSAGMKNNIKTRGATGLPETTCRRNIRRVQQAMGGELTERKPKKGEREAGGVGEGGKGWTGMSCLKRVLLCDACTAHALASLLGLTGGAPGCYDNHSLVCHHESQLWFSSFTHSVHANHSLNHDIFRSLTKRNLVPVCAFCLRSGHHRTFDAKPDVPLRYERHLISPTPPWSHEAMLVGTLEFL